MTIHFLRWLFQPLLVLLLVVLLCGASYPNKAYCVDLAWDPNPVEELVSGYKVHWGISSQTYTNIQDVLNVTIWNIDHLTPPLYFVVTAYNGEGLESNYSSEVYWTEAALPACSDTIDNDADSLIDFPEDPGCSSLLDTDETDESILIPAAACCGVISWEEYISPPGGTLVNYEKFYLPNGAWLIIGPDVTPADVWRVGR